MTIPILFIGVALFVTLNHPLGPRALMRFAIVALPALVITSYLTLPFIAEAQYLNRTPYLESWKYDSVGAERVLTSLFDGSLYDQGRLPVITLLLIFGIGWALATRSAQAIFALALFVVWIALFFGRATWGTLADLMPLHRGLLLFHRFAGPLDMGAILLIGLGGEWLLSRPLAPLREPWRIWVPVMLIALLMLPALRERWEFYRVNASWMEQAAMELKADQDLTKILARLRTLPPGRTYAGMRNNWGQSLNWGYLHFYDLLTFEQIVAFSPPYYAFSLNSDLMWDFDEMNPEQYRLFNVRYVIAPAAQPMTSFLKPILKTARYTLYQAETGGYTQLGQVWAVRHVASQTELLASNRDWIRSHDAIQGRFIEYLEPGVPTQPEMLNPEAGSWTVASERVGPQRIEVQVENSKAAVLVFKITYHPNWRVLVDGREQRPFMVSPSFVGVALDPGRHTVRAEYRSSKPRNALLALGCLTLLGLTGLRATRLRRFI